MAADGQQPDASALIADALDGIGQGVLIVGPDGCMVRGNRRFLELYEVDETTILPGIPFAQHLRMMVERGKITGSDPDKQIAERLAHLASRKDFTADRRLPNGTMIALTGHALANGGYAFTFTDVTERTEKLQKRERDLERTVEALRASQRRLGQDQTILRATLDNMAQGILVVDAGFDVKAFNDRLLDLFGIEADVLDNPEGFRRMVRHLAERGDYGKHVTPEIALESYASEARLEDQRIFELHLPLGRVLEVRSSPLPAGGFVSTYTDITRRSRAERSMQQRDAVVSALNVAANAILGSDDWRGPVETMLATLGEVTGASRVYLARDTQDETGKYKQEELYQWHQPGISSFWDKPGLKTMTVKDDAFQDWRERRARGEAMQVIVSDLDGEKRAWLELQDMKALVRLPVFVSGKWWGTIGFDDCVEERTWSEAEIEALRAAAGLIGVAVARAQATEVLRRREAELARKSEILAATLDNTIQTISVFDASHRLVAFNRRFSELMHLSPEYLATQPTFRELVRNQISNQEMEVPAGFDLPRDLEAATDYWMERAPPPAKAYTYERSRPDGNTIEVFSNPLPDGGFIRVVTNITERRRSEEGLRQALATAEEMEAKLRDILSSLPVGVLVMDSDRGIEMWNEAYTTYTGMPAEALAQHRSIEANSRYIWENFPHHQDVPIETFIEERMKRIFIDGPSVREVAFMTPRYDIQYIIAPLRAGGAVNVIVDITQQKESQREAVKARQDAEAIQAQLRAILNHLPIGVVVFDREAKLRYWNRKFCELTGTDESFYEDSTDLDQLCRHIYKKFPELQSMSLSDFTGIWVKRIFGDDFGPREIAFRIPPVMMLQVVAELPDGGRMVVIVDISKQKDSERQALKARQDAENANQAKSQFLAAMSHEIRTPMNGVLGMIELLKTTRLDAEQSEMVGVVRESANSLLKIIDDILDFSKIEAGKIEIEQAELSPLQVVEGVAETLAAEARRKEIAVLTFVDPAVPDPLAGDAVRLRQVLFNLVGNAIKFTSEGEVSISVRTAAEDEASVMLLFEVRDTGIGLDDEQLGRLFQPFVQADSSTTRRFGGTGLGLSISKRLVELMGGEISVASSPQKGSTFAFTIRLARRPAKPMAVRRPLQGQRLLVVDDSAMVRDLVCRYAVEAGAETGVAANAVEAMKELQHAQAAGAPYQAAILDIRLPDQDGWALARSIRKDEALAPIRLVLLTAFDEPEHRRDALAQGFSAYLTKPIRRSLLLSALVPALDKEIRAKAEELEAPAPDALILVAEDNPTNRAVIAKQLKKLGYRHEIFPDGRTALDAYDPDRHALVLTDCHMPVMDGFVLTQALRAAEAATSRHVPIVALTANALQGEAEKCLAAGMDDYIAKPAALAQLSSVLRKWTLGAAAAPVVAAQASEELPIFDREILDELFEDSTEERQKLIDLFAHSVEQNLVDLAVALEGNTAAAKELAHSIKGAARSSGAARVARAAETLEAALKSGGETGDLLARLASAFAEARREMKAR